MQKPPRNTPLAIGRQVFRNKTAAKEHMSVVLQRSPLDRELKGGDLQLVTDLYWMHPYLCDLIDFGIAGFAVAHNDAEAWKAQKSFYVIHDDGTWRTFSYNTAVDGYSKPSVPNATRRAIAQSQYDFKNAMFEGKSKCLCAGCGDFFPKAQIQVHHEHPWPFSRILEVWLELNPKPALIHVPVTGWEFEDTSLAQNFLEFHDSVAFRILLCPKCNRELGKMEKSKTTTSY